MGPKAGWDFSEKSKSLPPAGNGTPAHRARSLVTIPTELTRLLTRCHNKKTISRLLVYIRIGEASIYFADVRSSLVLYMQPYTNFQNS